MVYYLKINRKEEYTFLNLQRWVDVISEIDDARMVIVCDDKQLENDVKSRVTIKGDCEFIESVRDNPEVCDIVKGFANERWENAGYAHMTTFFHARLKGYSKFWNIDADDTFFALPNDRVRELLKNVEEISANGEAALLSLDMWYTKSCVKHWTFGISYTDNSFDWFKLMAEHVKDSKYRDANYPPNMDGYFSYLRGLGDCRIESFYAENLRFLHYSNDFFRRPWASGFYHWHNGMLEFPILKDCFGIESLGTVGIPDEVLGIDMGITDEESRKTMIETCYKADRGDLEYRFKG